MVKNNSSPSSIHYISSPQSKSDDKIVVKLEFRDDSEDDTILDASSNLYAKFPLDEMMLRGEMIRNKAFMVNAKKPRNYVKGTDGWLKSLFVLEGRALDNTMVPWLITTINAVIWTVVRKFAFVDIGNYGEQDKWEGVYSIVVNSSLAFLLVFRLNRVAVRYWETRTMWGKLVVIGRSLVSGILTHANHAPEQRDRAVAWVGAFAVSTMHYIRKETIIPPAKLAGLLSRQAVEQLQVSDNPPLRAASEIRKALKEAFCVTSETPVQLSYAWSIQLNLLEKLINGLIEQLGGMERVRSTPLPLVYVTHLRSCLLFYLLTLPYVWEESWGWGTIPVVSLTAFALLGIEGASTECEAPFKKNRTNHLEMDFYCMTLLNNIQQLVVESADSQEKKWQKK